MNERTQPGSVLYRGKALGLPVYLDNHATTPVDSRVLDAMLPFFRERFGNPHSVDHAYGRDAAEAVEVARAQVAQVLGARPQEIVFTSGATESNNLAILGAADFHGARKSHFVTCVTEHSCVRAAFRELERRGFEVSWLPVGPDGRVDPADVKAALRDHTCLVSVMAANNEVGVLQPVDEIGALCRERGVLLHTDAAQAFGKVPLDVNTAVIDLLSVSGHKIYGPKGIGVLYVRRRPRARIFPQIHGGGQERDLRSGTLPTPLCVGLGFAAEIARTEMVAEAASIGRLRDRLLAALRDGLPDIRINGNMANRLPGNLNVAIPGMPAEVLIRDTPEVAVSTGSACTSSSVEPSYVLRAMGLGDDLAHTSIRLGLGRFTTEAEVDFAAERIVATVARHRKGVRVA